MDTQALWLCYSYRFQLTQRPDVESRLLSELQGLGLPCDGDLAAACDAISHPECLRDTPYLTAVINEVMRMYPAGVSAAPR